MIRKITLLFTTIFVASLSFAQISTFPFTEDFEAEATCGTGCGASCVLTTYFNVTTDQADWAVDINGTTSSGTGPTANGGADHTTGASGGKYVYVETSTPCNANTQAELHSPWLDFSLVVAPRLSFWYHAFGTSQGNLVVEARVGTNGTWTNVAGPITDNLDAWQEWDGCIPFGSTDSVQVRFLYSGNTGFGGDFALDDIVFSTVDPVDVGVTVINVASGCGLTATETIDVTICNFGDSLLAGTMIPVSYSVDTNAVVTETLTLATGLSGLCSGGGCVNYTFTATEDLSVGGMYNFTSWTGIAGDAVASNDTSSAVSNSINTYGIPYFTDFESGTDGWVIDNGANGTWDFGTPANTIINSAGSGVNSFVTNLTGNYNTNEQSFVTSPCFDISAANGTEHVAMKAWWDAETSWDGANLFSSNDGGTSWSQVGALGDPLNWYNDGTINGAPSGSQVGWTGTGAAGTNGWVCVQHTLDSAMMVNNSDLLLRVGFGSDGSVTDEGFAFDDVAIGYPLGLPVFAQDSVIGCGEYVINIDAPYVSADFSNGASGSSVTITNTGTYIACAQDSFGLYTTDTIYIEIVDFLIPNFTDAIVPCIGDSVLYDALGDSADCTYSWSNGATTQLAWVYAPANVYVQKVDTTTGCSGGDTVIVLAYQTPVGLADYEECDGATVTLDASAPNSTYSWSTGDSTATVDVTTTNDVYVTVTDTVTGCVGVDTSVVKFNANPTNDLGNDTTVCNYFVIDGTNGDPVIYDWSTGDVGPTVGVTTSGAYGLTVTNTDGCSATDSVTVTIITASVDLGNDTTLCDTFALVLNAGTASSYLWSDLSTGQTLTVEEDGTYYVVITDTNTGCAAGDSINVTFLSCTVGIRVIDNSMNISLFPNPTDNEITLSLEDFTTDASFEIINIEGKTVRTGDISSSTTTLDLQELSNGAYIIAITMDNAIATRKFIINK